MVVIVALLVEWNTIIMGEGEEVIYYYYYIIFATTN